MPTPASILQLHTFTKEAFVEVFDFAGTGGIGETGFCDVFGAPVFHSSGGICTAPVTGHTQAVIPASRRARLMTERTIRSSTSS